MRSSRDAADRRQVRPRSNSPPRCPPIIRSKSTAPPITFTEWIRDLAAHKSTGGRPARSGLRQPFQGGLEAQTARSDQRRAECVGAALLAEGARKAAVDLLPAGQRPDEWILKRRVQIGAEMSLPGPLPDRVGADRPEMRTAADQKAIAQDQNAAVTAPHAIRHVHVKRVESVFHRSRGPLPVVA